MKFWIESQCLRLQFAWVNRKRISKAFRQWGEVMRGERNPRDFWKAVNPNHLWAHEEDA